MTEDKRKSTDDFSLSENPFSPDHEVTIIQTSPPIPPTSLDDEITEVTETDAKPITPAAEPSQAVQARPNPTTRPFRIRSSWPFKKTFKYFAYLALLILAVPLIEQTARHFSARPPKRSGVKPAVLQPIRLGPVLIKEPKRASSGLLAVKSGGILLLSVPVESWPKSNHELNFKVDFNIYSQRGKLLLFLPDQARFAGKLDSKREKLVLEERINLGQQVPLGLYRVKIVIREQASGKSATAETRFRVVP